MRCAGIHPNDLLIVDRALEATDGRVVVVALDGELTVKRLRLHGNELALYPENPAYPVYESSKIGSYWFGAWRRMLFMGCESIRFMKSFQDNLIHSEASIKKSLPLPL